MAWLPFAKLEITDGTTRINLLNQQDSGFCITDWQPSIQDLKSGGTWADAPTADERELIVAQLANSEDQFTFDVSAASPDELIGHLRAMRAMLQKAREYTTTTWQDTPVYLIAQGYGDTNARYTRIKNWRTPADGFPYGPPMWDTIQGNAIDDYQLIIEHGAWTGNVPGIGTATEISAVETYDGRNLGNVDDSGTREPTTANEVYVAPKRNTANLTDMYVDNGGVWSANKMDFALPYNILPAVPAVGDAAYFGIDTSLADSGPFCSLVFDIGTAGTGYTATWEYFNGAWVALTVQDNTNQDGAMTGIPLDTLGVNSVHWEQSSDWATRALNLDGGPAITGYFVRLRVTAIPGALVGAIQQNRDIYSIVWPYVEIQEDNTGGDIPSLIHMKLYNQSALSSGGVPELAFNRALVGLRSIDRGSDFTAYINIASEQNPAGITVLANGIYSAFTANVTTPTGEMGTVTFPFAGISETTVSFDETISAQFYGTYRCFLRAKLHAGNIGDVSIQISFNTGISIASNATMYSTKDVMFERTDDWQLLDFGILNIPGMNLNLSDLYSFYQIRIDTTAAAAATVYLYDLILLPVDEWSGDFFDTKVNTIFDIAYERYLDLDAITYPKYSPGISFNTASTTNRRVSAYTSITNGDFIIQAGANQRLWYVFERINDVGDWRVAPYISASLQIERNQRYWSMRGTS